MKTAKICLVAIGLCFLIAYFGYGAYYRVGLPSTRTLHMNWKRGDLFYGPNFVRLESECTDLTAGNNCFCAMDFKIMSSSPDSAKFANYIQSFGTSRVPVKFTVFHYYNVCRGAQLVTVGTWSSSKFSTNDKLLGGGGPIVHRGETVKTSGISPEFIGTPCNCFPQRQGSEGEPSVR